MRVFFSRIRAANSALVREALYASLDQIVILEAKIRSFKISFGILNENWMFYKIFNQKIKNCWKWCIFLNFGQKSIFYIFGWNLHQNHCSARQVFVSKNLVGIEKYCVETFWMCFQSFFLSNSGWENWG